MVKYHDAPRRETPRRTFGLVPHPQHVLRIHQHAARIHHLGARILGEVLCELAQRDPAVITVLERAASLTPEQIAAAGADRPVVVPLRLVP